MDVGRRRVGRNPPADVYAKGHRGIDGIYHKADERPPWLVAEAKYGKGSLGMTLDGRQMSDKWIDRRPDDAIGHDDSISDAIRSEGYQKVLVRVKHDNSLVLKTL